MSWELGAGSREQRAESARRTLFALPEPQSLPVPKVFALLAPPPPGFLLLLGLGLGLSLGLASSRSALLALLARLRRARHSPLATRHSPAARATSNEEAEEERGSY
jgi:hypothetical protein